MILTVIEQTPTAPLDRFAAWLPTPAGTAPEAALTVHVVRAWDGDALPVDAAHVGDGLLVLGGEANAYDDTAAPWLPATRELLADAVRSGVPTLGVCLGAQLLAVAAGGRVQVAAPPGREAGVIDVHPRPDAARDPLLGGLAADVPADHPLAGGVLAAMPSMHADAVVDLPPGAVWLASSRLYPYQAFRVGEVAWGLQFHPETSVETFAGWAQTTPDVDAEALVAQYRDRADQVEAGGRAIAQRFAQIVVRRAAGLPLDAALAATR
ncbi:type 1 glutamine amidotransferase [Actinotalea subterranea]|uniref:type 1 glutamine amidotransferase n=1 Tax=Actinotalea subterranea TaxID=2607497 RepID=UPI0011ED7A6D|nr:type 1 glutamine amidotransferase [Actinotalea subterranea]